MQHSPIEDGALRNENLDRLATAAGTLGRETVDISAFLSDLDHSTASQSLALGDADQACRALSEANHRAKQAATEMATASDDALTNVQRSTELIGASNIIAHDLAHWVQSVSANSSELEEMLGNVQRSNEQISEIASEVNILAVNAKIEAARAGQMGKGFSIVAEEINALSQQTTKAAVNISEVIGRLTIWMQKLNLDSLNNAAGAQKLLGQSSEADSALTVIGEQTTKLHGNAHAILEEVEAVESSVAQVGPAVANVHGSIAETANDVSRVTTRCEGLADLSEAMMQNVVELGGAGEDAPMIALVQDLSGQISRAFGKAVEQGAISMDALFSRAYRPIEGSNPEQVLAPFTALTDQLLPPIQEPVLDLDQRIVFCAAVNTDGYLPTHNLKFSKPQGDDAEWNAGNSRNRRIFDDRVGLKAGQSEKPFLLQIYRRDMGGGTFVMMKDLSAPITVKGRHWGGLRLAYRF